MNILNQKTLKQINTEKIKFFFNSYLEAKYLFIFQIPLQLDNLCCFLSFEDEKTEDVSSN